MSTSNKMDPALQRAIASVPDCVAGSLVDWDSGMLLGVKAVYSYLKEVIELLAAAISDLFQGPSIVTIEKLFRKARGAAKDGLHCFQEIVFNSDNLFHVFVRGEGQQQVARFVCRRSANPGVVLAKARMATPEIEAAL